MATTVPEPPKIEHQRDPSQRPSNSGNVGGRNLIPAAGDLRAVNDYSPPPSSTGIWVVLASISMTFLAFTSALVVRQGSANDWRHLALPAILYFNTVVLLASSFTLELARRQVGAFMAGPRTSHQADALAVYHFVLGNALCRRAVHRMAAAAVARTIPGYQSQ